MHYCTKKFKTHCARVHYLYSTLCKSSTYQLLLFTASSVCGVGCRCRKRASTARPRAARERCMSPTGTWARCTRCARPRTRCSGACSQRSASSSPTSTCTSAATRPAPTAGARRAAPRHALCSLVPASAFYSALVLSFNLRVAPH